MTDKIEKHLADIAKSLKILSGRERLEELTGDRALVEDRPMQFQTQIGPSGDSPALIPGDAPSNGESWGQGDLG